MAGDGVVPEGEGKPADTEVGKVVRGQIDGDLDGNSGRVVEQHKVLQCLMAFDVVGRDLQGEGGQLGGVVLLASRMTGYWDERARSSRVKRSSGKAGFRISVTR